MINEVELNRKQKIFVVNLEDHSILCAVCNTKYYIGGGPRDKKREKEWYKEHAIKCAKLTLAELQHLGLITKPRRNGIPVVKTLLDDK